jgi:hypothetical protein
MGLLLGVYSLGKHAWVMRENDAYTVPNPGGVTGAESKPDGTDPAYIDIGAIEDWEDDVSGGQDQEVWRPSPGRLVLKDVLEIKPKFTCKFTTGEVSPFSLEAFYRTTQKLDSASAQFNPLSGKLRKVWFHTQLYDQDDNLIVTLDLWGRIKVTGGIKSQQGALLKPTWELLVLYSSLNSALL